jgi:hypothetical protein
LVGGLGIGGQVPISNADGLAFKSAVLFSPVPTLELFALVALEYLLVLH